MRRLIAAGIILALILIVSITGITIIRQNYQAVESRMERIVADPTAEKQQAEEFMVFWNDHRELLALFINHEEIDEIGRVAARMVSAERTRNTTDILEAADEILFIMHGIAEDERFSWFTFL